MFEFVVTGICFGDWHWYDRLFCSWKRRCGAYSQFGATFSSTIHVIQKLCILTHWNALNVSIVWCLRYHDYQARTYELDHALIHDRISMRVCIFKKVHWNLKDILECKAYLCLYIYYELDIQVYTIQDHIRENVSQQMNR